jgi:hypothetical protein
MSDPALRNLENLILGSSKNLENIITQISLDCKKLVGLRASCGACMDIKNLLMILQGCKEPCIRTLMQETA